MLSANLCLKILKYIRINKFVSSLDIACEFNMSRRNALRYVRILKYHGYVEVKQGNNGGVQFKEYL